MALLFLWSGTILGVDARHSSITLNLVGVLSASEIEPVQGRCCDGGNCFFSSSGALLSVGVSYAVFLVCDWATTQDCPSRLMYSVRPEEPVPHHTKWIAATDT